MERVKDYEEEGVKEVAGHELPGTFKWQMDFVCTQKYSWEYFWDSNLLKYLQGWVSNELLFPPLAWRWLCKRPGSVFVQTH